MGATRARCATPAQLSARRVLHICLAHVSVAGRHGSARDGEHGDEGDKQPRDHAPLPADLGVVEGRGVAERQPAGAGLHSKQPRFYSVRGCTVSCTVASTRPAPWLLTE
eukprot:3178155-Prymnesium_polylepis.1